MTRRLRRRLVLTVYWGGLAAVALLLALTITAFPTAHCHGYTHIPLRHPMSDLYGGAVERDIANCRLP